MLDIDAAGKTRADLSERSKFARRRPPRESARVRPFSLPGEGTGFHFRTVPPAGRGLLIAVVSDRNERLGDLAARHKDLAVVPSPEAYLVEIGEALGAARREQPNGSGWSIASREYEIVAPDAK